MTARIDFRTCQSVKAVHGLWPFATAETLRAAVDCQRRGSRRAVLESVIALSDAFNGQVPQAIRRLLALLKSGRTDAEDRPYVADILVPLLSSAGQFRLLAEVIRIASPPSSLLASFVAVEALVAAAAGRYAASRKLADRALRLAWQGDDVRLGRVLTRCAFAAYHRRDYAEAYVRGLEGVQVHEQVGSHWTAGVAYSLPAVIAGDWIRDTKLSAIYTEKILFHAGKAGNKPMQKWAWGNLLVLAAISHDLARYHLARRQLADRPIAEQFLENFAITISEAMGAGWSGEFDMALRSIELIPEAIMRTESQRGLRDALVAIAFLARWDVDEVRKYARRAIVETKRGRMDALSDAVFRDSARLSAAASCILIGDVERGRRAMNMGVDPGHAVLDATTADGIDIRCVPTWFRGVAEYVNAAVRASKQYRPKYSLTRAEVEVLRMLPGEGTVRDIAATLGKSRSTVAHQIESIYSKLGVSGRLQAVERARDVGLIGSGTKEAAQEPY